MATIYNSDLTKELINGAKLETARDKVPNQIADKVVPVMEVNPRLTRPISVVKTNTATNSVGTTIYTTPTDQDFFITAAQLSMVKDATATSTISRLRAYVNGEQTTILRVEGFTLTAQNEVVSITFNNPLKIDRNTAISVNNTTNVANVTASAIIFGYLEEI